MGGTVHLLQKMVPLEESGDKQDTFPLRKALSLLDSPIV